MLTLRQNLPSGYSTGGVIPGLVLVEIDDNTSYNILEVINQQL